MLKTLWNAAHRQELDRRITRLTPQHTPRWGRMTAPQMVAHLTDAVRMATGEVQIRTRRTLFRHPPLKQLMVYLVPIPRGLPTAKELQRAPKPWDVEMADLRAMLETFAARDRKGSWPPHPVFGPLSARAWGVLTLRHLDHHLRQFGA